MKIRNFRKDRKGRLSFSVYGARCEDIVCSQYCVVSFKENIPHFEILMPSSEFNPSEKTVPNTGENEEEKLCGIISFNGGVL